MAKEFKTGIFWDLIKTLFLVLLLYGFKNQNRKFLWLDKTFVFCSFLCFWFPKREVSITWQDVCSYFFVYSCKIHNSFKYKNGTDKIAGKYPGWEFETWKYVRWKIGMSDEITVKSEFLPDNVWPFEHSYVATYYFLQQMQIETPMRNDWKYIK